MKSPGKKSLRSSGKVEVAIRLRVIRACSRYCRGQQRAYVSLSTIVMGIGKKESRLGGSRRNFMSRVLLRCSESVGGIPGWNRVEFDGNTSDTVAGSDGLWRAFFPDLDAGGRTFGGGAGSVFITDTDPPLIGRIQTVGHLNPQLRIVKPNPRLLSIIRN